MITKPLVLLAALTLSCCIATLNAFPMQGCKCIRTISTRVNLRVIKKLEVIPISGQCRWIQIIVFRKNGSRVCINPKEKWIIDLLENMQKYSKNVTSSSTIVSSTGSTINL